MGVSDLRRFGAAERAVWPVGHAGTAAVQLRLRRRPTTPQRPTRPAGTDGSTPQRLIESHVQTCAVLTA
eukprot:9683290-Alexandrium_andersonii.AAC.1